MKFLSILALILTAQVANAQSTDRHGDHGGYGHGGVTSFNDLRMRLQGCGNTPSSIQATICVGSIILDGIELSMMNNTTPMPPMPPMPVPNYPAPMPSQQKLVTIFGASDNCSGSVVASNVLTGNYNLDLQQCQNIMNKNATSWSISINGRCINIQDTTAFGACTTAITANPQ